MRVELGRFALQTLATSGSREVPLSERIEAALRFYLASPRTQPGWRYPPELGGFPPSEGEEEPVELEIDSILWADVSFEAAVQSVEAAQLIGHAILFCIADADAAGA